MGFNVKVAATGVIALCLVLSAILFISGTTNPSLYEIGEQFFGLAVVLIFLIIVLSVFGVRIRFP